MKFRLFISILIFLAIILLGGFLFVRNVGHVSIPPYEKGSDVPGEYAHIINTLTLPPGFSIEVFADNLPGARTLALDERGRLFVSQTSEGKVSIIHPTSGANLPAVPQTLLEGLNRPHGLVFRCDPEPTLEECYLYVAEHHMLSRYKYFNESAEVGLREDLLSFPASLADRHYTRSLLFLPSPNEDILLVSIGSSCDVDACHEEDSRYGSIIAYNIRTGEAKEYASGLRNAVFMEVNYVDGRVFATEMGRDGLGDDIPPDEVNIIEEGNNYGWPICYGKNIHDTAFDKNTYIRNPCQEPFETESFIDLPAHSAPLGLAFVPEEGWSEDYWYDLLIAYHGSWNRSVPTGYKIVRARLDARGEYEGTEDFITGWLTKSGTKTGRPVDIMLFPGSTGYITDDLNGLVYRFFRSEEVL